MRKDMHTGVPLIHGSLTGGLLFVLLLAPAVASGDTTGYAKTCSYLRNGFPECNTMTRYTTSLKSPNGASFSFSDLKLDGGSYLNGIHFTARNESSHRWTGLKFGIVVTARDSGGLGKQQVNTLRDDHFRTVDSGVAFDVRMEDYVDELQSVEISVLEGHIDRRYEIVQFLGWLGSLGPSVFNVLVWLLVPIAGVVLARRRRHLVLPVALLLSGLYVVIFLASLYVELSTCETVYAFGSPGGANYCRIPDWMKGFEWFFLPAGVYLFSAFVAIFLFFQKSEHPT